MLGAIGCEKDDDFLDVQPTSIVPQDVAFSDPNLVLSILADLYNRYYDFSSLDGNPADGAGWRTFADFSESFPSENGEKIWSFKEQVGVMIPGIFGTIHISAI